MENSISRQASDRLYVLKALAIMSAAAAHCGGYGLPLAQRMSNLLGTVGVPMFFLLSGLFLWDEEPGVFWRKKIRTLVVPWWVWGCVTFFVSLLLGGNEASLSAFADWILGRGSWLYFVPMLLMSFALFRICSHRLWPYFLAGLSLFSNLLTTAGVWRNVGGLSVYQNVLNWVGFFALGVILRSLDLDRWTSPSARWRYGCCGLTLLLAVLYLYGWEPSYWTPLSIPFELSCGAAMLCLSGRIGSSRLLRDIGKNTYPIFFAHMQFGIGLLNRVGRLLPRLGRLEYGAVFLRPVLVVLVTYGLILLGRALAERMGLGRWLWLLGIRREE